MFDCMQIWCRYDGDTNPKSGEVRVGVIVCLVVSVHQRGDDLTLFFRESGSPCLFLCLALRLLLLPPLNQVLFPLHFLVCQNDWMGKIERVREFSAHWKTSFQGGKKSARINYNKNTKNGKYLGLKLGKIKNEKKNLRRNAFKAFQSGVVCYIVLTAMSMLCWVKVWLLFSGGRERQGMGPYGDPCCSEQLKALSLFCLLLVVLATELAHRNRESGRERAGSQQHAAVFCFKQQ